MAAATDDELLLFARREGRVIVTLDAGFHALLALSNAANPSVVRLRIEGLRARPLAALLRTVLTACDADLRAGAVVSVETGSVRVRALPLVR
jgi:predicted nuclease of predicted toxin-antitoxin system